MERYIETMEPADFKEVYHEVIIDEAERKKIIDEFYSNTSLEWNK